MAPYKDLTGLKYNMLAVLELSHKDNRGRSHWLCKCDCGNNTTIQGYDITSGHAKSCGCQKWAPRLKLDHTGEKFGRLTAFKYIKSPGAKKHRMWECICDCGAITIVSSTNLATGHTTSCGRCFALSLEESEKRRTSQVHRVWRKTIYLMSDFTCFICGIRGGKLHAHHLFQYAAYPDFRTSISNGVCLCVKCHKEYHSQYGKINNIPSQFEEFRINRQWELKVAV